MYLLHVRLQYRTGVLGGSLLLKAAVTKTPLTLVPCGSVTPELAGGYQGTTPHWEASHSRSHAFDSTSPFVRDDQHSGGYETLRVRHMICYKRRTKIILL